MAAKVASEGIAKCHPDGQKKESLQTNPFKPTPPAYLVPALHDRNSRRNEPRHLRYLKCSKRAGNTSFPKPSSSSAVFRLRSYIHTYIHDCELSFLPLHSPQTSYPFHPPLGLISLPHPPHPPYLPHPPLTIGIPSFPFPPPFPALPRPALPRPAPATIHPKPPRYPSATQEPHLHSTSHSRTLWQSVPSHPIPSQHPSQRPPLPFLNRRMRITASSRAVDVGYGNILEGVSDSLARLSPPPSPGRLQAVSTASIACLKNLSIRVLSALVSRLSAPVTAAPSAYAGRRSR